MPNRQGADYLVSASGNRDAALLSAHRDSGVTIDALAKQIALSVSHVGRLIGREEVKCRT